MSSLLSAELGKQGRTAGMWTMRTIEVMLDGRVYSRKKGAKAKEIASPPYSVRFTVFPDLGGDEATFELVTRGRLINLWADDAKQRQTWADALARFSGERAAEAAAAAADDDTAGMGSHGVSLTPVLSSSEL